MNLGKSVLFATAAGFISVAGAQAADLPVKAKPVEGRFAICNLQFQPAIHCKLPNDKCKLEIEFIIAQLRPPQSHSCVGPLRLKKLANVTTSSMMAKLASKCACSSNSCVNSPRPPGNSRFTRPIVRCG